MLTRRTRRQLLAFALISLLGTTYVGARYARLDRLVLDTTYEVTAQFDQSGGIFTGAEVSYRGVRVGTVSDMRLTGDGVDVILSIENSSPPIPADTLAQVANRSAVGEQYVDLQPRTDHAPYLRDGSVIAERSTSVPVSPTEVLTAADDFITSVPAASLRTTVSEMGSALQGSANDIAQMIDTSNEFIQAASDSFDATTDLIKDSNKVLRTQAAKRSAIRSFARDLSLFSGTLADNDNALRRLIDDGSATTSQLQTFLEQNGVNLGQLINNLVTTGEVVVKHVAGIGQVLTLYPYVVAGGYTVVAKGPSGFETRSGFVLNSEPPLCHDGYDPREQRPPTDRSDKPMDEDAYCAEPPTKSNPRGSQNSPRVAPGAVDRPAEVATYDIRTGELTWREDGPMSTESAFASGWYRGGLSRLLLQALI